jgi:hypothetical protein
MRDLRKFLQFVEYQVIAYSRRHGLTRSSVLPDLLKLRTALFLDYDRRGLAFFRFELDAQDVSFFRPRSAVHANFLYWKYPSAQIPAEKKFF